MGRTPQARQYFQASRSPSAKFPFAIIDTPEEIFGLVARLMDPKRVDGKPSFAVTTSDSDGKWMLWLDELNKEYIIGD